MGLVGEWARVAELPERAAPDIIAVAGRARGSERRGGHAGARGGGRLRSDRGGADSLARRLDGRGLRQAPAGSSDHPGGRKTDRGGEGLRLPAASFCRVAVSRRVSACGDVAAREAHFVVVTGHLGRGHGPSGPELAHLAGAQCPLFRLGLGENDEARSKPWSHVNLPSREVEPDNGRHRLAGCTRLVHPTLAWGCAAEMR
jgi:hypothetical protein